MEKSIKKKLKIVLWVFFIITIPAGFFIYSTVLLDNAYEAYEEAVISDDNKKIEFALEEVIKAEPFAFYNKNLINIKVQLLYGKKEYRKSLNAIKKKGSIYLQRTFI